MKNKKILFFSTLFFLSGILAIYPGKVDAASCGASGKGTCESSSTSGASCSSGTKVSFDLSSCCELRSTDSTRCQNGLYYICCESATAATNTTCTENGGSCMSSCGSGYSSISGTGCRSSQVCCKSDGSEASGDSEPLNINFENPLDYDSVEGLLAAVMQGFQGIVVLFAMIFFVWGATGYIMSAGDQTKMEGAKKGMIAALIGMALGIAAPSLLKTIGMILGWGTTDSCTNIKDATAKQTCIDTMTNAPTTAEIGINVLEFLLGIVGILGMIMIVVGGIMYFTAGANEKSVETAKGIVKYAIIGLALALASMIIVRQVATLLT